MDVHKNSQVMTQLSIIRLSNIFSVCYFNFTVCNISQNYVWKTLFIEQNLMDKLKKKKKEAILPWVPLRQTSRLCGDAWPVGQQDMSLNYSDSAAQFRTEQEKNKVWLLITFVDFRAGLYLKAEIDQSGACAVKGEAANTATVSCHLVWNLKCHNHWLLLTPSNNLRCMRQEWPWHYVCDIHFDFKQQPYR